MTKTALTLAEARATLKGLGYTLKTRRNSSFISGTVTHVETGDQVSAINAMTPDFYKKHKAFFDFKNGHTVQDGQWRVIL